MEACNIDLNHYSNHDVFSEHKFRVYSNIEILDCPSGTYIFNVLINGMVGNYDIFVEVFTLIPLVNMNHVGLFSVYIMILHGRYLDTDTLKFFIGDILSPLFYLGLIVCVQNHCTSHIKDSHLTKKKKNPLILKLKFRSVACGVMPLITKHTVP